MARSRRSWKRGSIIMTFDFGHLAWDVRRIHPIEHSLFTGHTSRHHLTAGSFRGARRISTVEVRGVDAHHTAGRLAVRGRLVLRSGVHFRVVELGDRYSTLGLITQYQPTCRHVVVGIIKFSNSQIIISISSARRYSFYPCGTVPMHALRTIAGCMRATQCQPPRRRKPV